MQEMAAKRAAVAEASQQLLELKQKSNADKKGACSPV